MPRSVLGAGGYDEGTWRLLGNGPSSGWEATRYACLQNGEIVSVVRDEDNSEGP